MGKLGVICYYYHMRAALRALFITNQVFYMQDHPSRLSNQRGNAHYYNSDVCKKCDYC